MFFSCIMFKKYYKLQILLVVLCTNLLNNNILHSMESNSKQKYISNNNHNNINIFDIFDNQSSIDGEENNNQSIINNYNGSLNIENISNDEDVISDDENNSHVNIKDNQNNNKINIRNEINKFEKQYVNFRNAFYSSYKCIQASQKLFEKLTESIQKIKQSFIDDNTQNVKTEYVNVNNNIINDFQSINNNLNKYKNTLYNFDIIPQVFNDNLYKNVLLINSINTIVDKELVNKYKILLEKFSKYINSQNENFNKRLDISITLRNLKNQISNISHEVNKIVISLQKQSYLLIDHIKLTRQNIRNKLKEVDKNNSEIDVNYDIILIIDSICNDHFIMDFINSIQNIKHINYTNEILSRYNK